MFVPSDDRVQILTCRVIPPMIAMIAHGEVDTGLKLLERSYRMFTGVNPGGLWNPTDIARADGTFHPRGFGHYVMCGGVWAVMKALHGWDYNAPQQALRVGPVLDPDACHGPWITPAAYGTLRQTAAGGRQNLRCWRPAPAR